MVVAVAAVRMMQVSAHQVVHMVAMRDRFVSAAGAMLMACIVPVAPMAWRALRRIGCAHLEDMFVEMVTVRMVQAAVVQIVNMSAVLHGEMPAILSMDVIMAFVN